jgi:hypothetical protein
MFAAPSLIAAVDDALGALAGLDPDTELEPWLADLRGTSASTTSPTCSRTACRAASASTARSNPVVTESCHVRRPFYWGDAAYLRALLAADRRLFDEARDFRILGGFTGSWRRDSPARARARASRSAPCVPSTPSCSRSPGARASASPGSASPARSQRETAFDALSVHDNALMGATYGLGGRCPRRAAWPTPSPSPASGLTRPEIETLIPLSQRLMVLHQGRGLVEGDPEDMVHDPEVIRACYSTSRRSAWRCS